MVKCTTISTRKANRLFWLGRYTERVYLTLHLLRKYYDKMIDGDPKDYEEFYQKLDAINNYPSMEEFRLGQMYDAANPSSLVSGLINANNNGIVLREEIMSETLSYVQLSLVHLQKLADKKEENITFLQPITDYLLAFWGSVDERVIDERVWAILKVGKLVENIDMLIRFDYPFSRIDEAYRILKRYGEAEGFFDAHLLAQLNKMLTPEQYPLADKYVLMKYLTQLVLL